MGLPSKLTMTTKMVAAAVIVIMMFGQALQVGHDAASADPSVHKSRRGFAIHGIVGHLYPGKHAVLTVRVRNYHVFALTLRRISVRIHRPSPRCAADNVVIRPFIGHRRIGAGRFIRVKLKVFMRKKAPNGCQGARFALAYHGKAVRA